MSDFERDEDCIAQALLMWSNWIETGDPVLTRDDVIQQLKSCGDSREMGSQRRRLTGMLRTLSDEQQAMVARLRRLAAKAPGGK